MIVERERDSMEGKPGGLECSVSDDLLILQPIYDFHAR